MRILLLKGRKVALVKSRCKWDNTIALVLECVDEQDKPTGETFDVITVNLEQSKELPWGYVFIDSNNGYDYYAWMLRHQLGTKTDRMARSGFCLYKAIKLCPDILRLKEGEYL